MRSAIQTNAHRLWPFTTELVTLDVGTTFQNLEAFEMALSFTPHSA